MNIVKRMVNQPTKRSVRKYRPAWNPVDNIFSMFDHSFPLDLAPLGFNQGWPSLNMKDEGNNYLVEIDVPGYGEENLEISIDGRQLTVTGTYEDKKEEEQDKYLVYERSSRNFVRTVNVPEGADLDTISAELRRGVLFITIPKTEDAHSPKKVNIISKE